MYQNGVRLSEVEFEITQSGRSVKRIGQESRWETSHARYVFVGFGTWYRRTCLLRVGSGYFRLRFRHVCLPRPSFSLLWDFRGLGKSGTVVDQGTLEGKRISEETLNSNQIVFLLELNRL